jgi:hypothetical protein
MKAVSWVEGVPTDQGSEGACVGFAWMNELLASPKEPKHQPEEEMANKIALSYYKRAQRLDDWPGENYEGTSVLAGAKVMKESGYIGEYRWCFGIDDVRDALIVEGPVVIGVPWYEGMYETKPNGLVQLKGKNVGGHAITLTGYYPSKMFDGKREEVFRWRNSWGRDYGIDGSGYIRYTDLAKLLADSGEACVPMHRETPVFGQQKKTKQTFWQKVCKKLR